MSSHLWTDVGQPKDFVTESRPDPKTLNYTPLTGKDPDRPKPRDKANVEALQAELERDLVRNAARGDHPKAAAKGSSKGSAKGSAKTGTNVRHAAAQPAD